jgi:hypothetical protein
MLAACHATNVVAQVPERERERERDREREREVGMRRIGMREDWYEWRR